MNVLERRRRERRVRMTVEPAAASNEILAGFLWVVVSATSVGATYLLFQSFMNAKTLVDKRREDPRKEEAERQERIKKLTGRN